MFFKSNNDNNLDVEIFIINGSKVCKRDNVSEMTIENLRQGIYFFKVMDKAQNKFFGLKKSHLCNPTRIIKIVVFLPTIKFKGL